MAGRGLFYGDAAGGSVFNGVLFQKQGLMSSSNANIGSLLAPSFLASGSMFSFGDVNGGNKSDRSFFDQGENEIDEFEEYLHQPEKKRRLSVDQVQFLEKSFEVENKLEPERKVQLAKELGLQPRQIAIWFQNRRARWKTKQLEGDYEALRNKYDNLKADYTNLVKEKEVLSAEVIQLTDKLLLKEKYKGELAASDIKMLSDALPKENMVDPVLENEMSKVSVKQHQDLNSAKSDVSDSESPHYTDGMQGDSCYAFEPEQSDVSQEEEENLLAKIGHDPMTSCFGFPVEDQGFGFWSF